MRIVDNEKLHRSDTTRLFLGIHTSIIPPLSPTSYAGVSSPPLKNRVKMNSVMVYLGSRVAYCRYAIRSPDCGSGGALSSRFTNGSFNQCTLKLCSIPLLSNHDNRYSKRYKVSINISSYLVYPVWGTKLYTPKIVHACVEDGLSCSSIPSPCVEGGSAGLGSGFSNKS